MVRRFEDVSGWHSKYTDSAVSRSANKFCSALITVAASLLLLCDGCRSSSMSSGKTVYRSALSLSPEIRVVTPADEDFHAELTALLGEQTQVMEQLTPFLLIVDNQGKRKIVAYSPLWTITGADGETGYLTNLSLKYPGAVDGTSSGTQSRHGAEIYPGETRIATEGIAGDKNIVRDAELWQSEPHGAAFFKQRAESQQAEFKDAALVEIGLDAAIFDDGELVGRDRGHLQQHFSAYVNASQKIDREIIEAIHAGATIDQAFDKVRPEAAGDYTPTGKPIWETHFYSAIAAQDALRWRSEHGDAQLIAHFQAALRETPFIVRRK